MKIALIVVGAILVLFLVFCGITGNIVVKRIMNPKFKTRSERAKTNQIDGFLSDTEKYSREPISFVMKDGYEINGDITINDQKRFVIFAHGHGSNREGCIKFTKVFYDSGYSFVLYDQRGHGDNQKTQISMGIQESKDLAEIVRKIKEKFGNDIEIGLFGYSMGGATVCLASQYLQDDVKFIVSDCAYSSLKEECHNQCIVHKIPFIPTILFMKLFFKINYHLSLKYCDVKATIKNNKIPICFFHGCKDKTVFASNAKKLFDASTSKIKRLYLFDDADHSKCIEVNRDLYVNNIISFLKGIGD